MKNEIIIFEKKEVKLEVNMKDETVWLSLEQMSKLFDRDKSVISRHIKNVLEEELDNSVVANFATTALDGKTYQVAYYNLDMIISVGYRVKSQNGIVFRRWANKILKDYLLKGYVVNQKRLEYLEKTVKLIDIASRIDDELTNDNARNIIKVISDYSKALNLLDDFDYNKIPKPKNINTSKDKITYEECINVIKELSFSDNSSLFALERNKGLEQIINNIYSSFDNNDLYKSLEEKAANLLYLIVKDHVFIDGNKRIGATIFIYFLNKFNLLYKDNVKIIDNNTLACMTILIAQSNPKEKDLIIDLILNFLS